MRDLVLCLQGCLEITRPSLHAEGGDTVRSGTQASRQQMPVCQASGLWALSQEADKPCGCPSGHTLRRGLRGPALNCLQGPFHLLGVPQPLPRARAGCLHPHPHPHGEIFSFSSKCCSSSWPPAIFPKLLRPHTNGWDHREAPYVPLMLSVLPLVCTP